MGTVVSIVIGFIIVAVVIGAVVEIVKVIFKVSIGLASLIVLIVVNVAEYIFYSFALLIAYLITGFCFFESKLEWGTFFIVYLVITAALVKYKGKKKVRSSIESLIKNDKIFKKSYADNLLPWPKTKFIFNFLYDRNYNKKFIKTEIQNNQLCEKMLADENIYYFTQEGFVKFFQPLRNDAIHAMDEYMDKYGIIDSDKINDVISMIERIVVEKRINDMPVSEYFDGMKISVNYINLYCKDYINTEIKNNKIIEKSLVDGMNYYFHKNWLDDFTQQIKKIVFEVAVDYMKKHGIVYREQVDETVKWIKEVSVNELTGKDCSVLYDCMRLKSCYVDYYCGQLIEVVSNNKDVRKLSVKKVDGVLDVYIFENIVNERWKELCLLNGKNYAYKIPQKKMEESFGKHPVAIQNAILHFVEKKLMYVYDNECSLWLEMNYQKNHSCPICKKYTDTLVEYGPKKYCKKCLAKIHAEEDAQEEEGKTVKRYISAPPPGVKIRGV